MPDWGGIGDQNRRNSSPPGAYTPVGDVGPQSVVSSVMQGSEGYSTPGWESWQGFLAKGD